MESYQQILEALLSGKVVGAEEYGLIPEHVETQISHVFLFPKTVYKICKRDNRFFNEHFRDLSDQKTRIDFYKADFEENSYFSPEVYVGIYSVVVENDSVGIDSRISEDSEDVVMKMNRIDLKHNLSYLLHDKTLMEEDFYTMGFQQTKAVANFPHQPKTNEIFYDIFQRRLDDLRDWMYSAPDFFSLDLTDTIIGKLRKYLDSKKEHFIAFDVNKYVVSIDNHSDNIFYNNGSVFFLDIYPPKEDWMVVVPWINIYRPATDILILMGEKYARAFLKGFQDFYGEFDESHELFYFLYSAGIQGVSLFNLSKNNEIKAKDAGLYKRFILENIDACQ